jgi:hypothetical protein
MLTAHNKGWSEGRTRTRVKNRIEMVYLSIMIKWTIKGQVNCVEKRRGRGKDVVRV